MLHSKFRFRSATFFKTSKLELACEKHKDRVLVTGLRTRTLPLPKGVENSATPPPPPQSDAAAAAADAAATVAQANSDNGGKAGTAGVPSSSEGMSTCHTGRLLMVINCHLTGGPAPERRMRQVLDGLDTARKEAAKLLAAEAAAAAAAARRKSKGDKKGGGGAGGAEGNKGGKVEGGAASAPAPGTSAPVVVCGDFNSNGRTAVWELLTRGVVEASFRERGYPEVRVLQKKLKVAGKRVCLRQVCEECRILHSVRS